MSCEVIVILSSSEDESDGGGGGVGVGGVEKKRTAPALRRVIKEEEEEEEEEEEDDDDDDCCILSSDPFLDELIDLKGRLSLSDPQSHDDLVVVAERGQVACRDYPHSRHLCAKYPFNKTSHESCCLKCFCYVCEVAAPCESWNEKDGGHCNAYEDFVWKYKRDKLHRPGDD